MKHHEGGPPAKIGGDWYLRSLGRATVRLLVVVVGVFPVTLLNIEKATLQIREGPPCFADCPPAIEVASTAFGFDVTAPLSEQFVAFAVSRGKPISMLVVVLGVVAVIFQWYSLRDGPGLRDRFRPR